MVQVMPGGGGGPWAQVMPGDGGGPWAALNSPPPIWSTAYHNWNAPWGNFDEWAPWYKPLESRIPAGEAAGGELAAMEIYNQLLPFLHPKDMQKYLRSITTSRYADPGGPFESYRWTEGDNPDRAANWEPPRRLSMGEEYQLSKRDKIGRVADVLLGSSQAVNPGEYGGPQIRPGDANIDSLTGGLIEQDDEIRNYVEALLRVGSQYAPGSSRVGSRRTLAQQAVYETEFQDALAALRAAEEASDRWKDDSMDSGYISNILEEVLQPGYYTNPGRGGITPSKRTKRYLLDETRPSYYYY